LNLRSFPVYLEVVEGDSRRNTAFPACSAHVGELGNSSSRSGGAGLGTDWSDTRLYSIPRSRVLVTANISGAGFFGRDAISTGCAGLVPFVELGVLGKRGGRSSGSTVKARPGAKRLGEGGPPSVPIQDRFRRGVGPAFGCRQYCSASVYEKRPEIGRLFADNGGKRGRTRS